jgi:hypothetical protein
MLGMNLTKNILSSVVAGLILAILGVYLTGYTSALVMPTIFAGFMWAWDILIVQFLGFGLLAIVLSYLVAYLSKLNFLCSVITIFVIAQLYLFFMMGGNMNLFWPNILTMLICLFTGWFAACKKY